MVSEESSLRCRQTASTYWLGVVRSSIAAARQNGGFGSFWPGSQQPVLAVANWQLSGQERMPAPE